MSHFHLLRPEWLVALLPLALLLWWKYRQRPRAGDWSAVCDSALLPFVLTAGHRTGRKLALSLLGIGGILAVLALAGPTWRQLEQPVFQPRSSLVILLDLSRSMDANDLAPSRLTRARYKLLDILQRRREGETGLIVYAAQPFVVSPLTEDTGTIAALVQSLTSDIVPSQGSRADLALEQGFRLLSAANAVDGHLLIITDGIAPGLTDRVLANRPANFSVSILAVGTPEGAPIPLPGGGFLKSDAGEIVISSLGSEELRRIAANGRGVYTELAANDRDLDLLFPVFATAPLTGAEKSAGLHSDRWHEEGPWLILPLLPLAAFAFRRGYLLLALCLVLPIAEPVSASQWDQLWQRPDQLGFAQLTDGDPAGAATYFEDPEWRSAAHYRAGEYQQSLDALAGVNTPGPTTIGVTRWLGWAD